MNFSILVTSLFDNVIKGYGTQKYVDVHEKCHFLEIQELRPLNTC